MEDIAVHIAPKDAFHCLFNGIDLIGAHDQQQFFGREHAITRQDVQQRVSGEKCFCEIDQIGNDFVVRVRPERREFKTVGRFLFASASGIRQFFDTVESGGV